MRKPYAAGIADLLRDAAILHHIAYRLAASVLTARHKYRISDIGLRPATFRNEKSSSGLVYCGNNKTIGA